MADPVPAIVDLSSSGKKKALTKGPPPLPVNPDPWLATVERLAPTVGVDGIKELMALRREERAQESKQAFNTAMAAARGEITPIVKRHAVQFGNTSYKHEDLGDIASIIDPILARHGLSYRYRGSSNINQPVSVTCIVFHEAGYSEETTLHAAADMSGGKNSIQGIGSAVTYLQRYTLRLAVGLATTRDDDGRAAGTTDAARIAGTISDAQRDAIQSAIVEGNRNLEKFLKYFKIENVGDLPIARYVEAAGMLSIKHD